MALATVSQDIQQLTTKLGLCADLALLERSWDIELGPLAKLARIVAVDREALVVEVDSSSVMQELTLRKKEVLRRLNKHFPTPIIKWLTLRIA